MEMRPLVSRDVEFATSSLQKEVAAWMQECFGEEITKDRKERNQRFLEEALELVQANGYNRAAAHRMVDYVFDRPVGEIQQEVGGVMVTLVALANEREIGIGAVTNHEVERIWEAMPKIREKQKQKPPYVEDVPPAPVPEWNDTNAQKAIIMAMHGTPQQKEDARRFFVEHLTL